MKFENGLEVKEPLDKEVIPCLALLNRMRGVRTWSSCSGHGLAMGMVSFYCSNYKALKRIIMAVSATPYGFPSETILRGGVVKYKQRLWGVDFACNGLDVIWDIRMARNGYEQRINTTRAWRALEKSLSSVRGREE